jgi:hypothetical protein
LGRLSTGVGWKAVILLFFYKKNMTLNWPNRAKKQQNLDRFENEL